MSERCTNCAAPREGSYCPACGQRAGGLDQPLGAFAREFAEEALGLDSRVRLTLPALFLRPGEIAKEYVEGRRVRFVPPIRLYLLTSFVMFLVLSQAGVEVENMTVTVDGTPVVADSAATTPEPTAAAEGALSEPTAAVEGALSEPVGAVGEAPAGSPEGEEDALADRISRGLAVIADDPDAFSRLFFNRLAQSMFFLLPAFALFLKMANPRRPYLHHGVFAIYLHCFVFIVVAASSLPDAFGLTSLASAADALMIVIPFYIVLAMKRFYDEGWVRTTLKAAAVSLMYGLVGGTTMVGLLVVSLATM